MNLESICRYSLWKTYTKWSLHYKCKSLHKTQKSHHKKSSWFRQALNAGDVYRLQVMLNLQPQA